MLGEQPVFNKLPPILPVGHFGELYRGELKFALMRFGLTLDESRAFFDEHSRMMLDSADEVSLFPGIAEMLNGLPTGSYSIVSSARRELIETSLAGAGVETKGLVILGHEIRKSKAEKLGSVLANLGHEAREAVYVGDMESDVLYMRDIGVDCVAVSYGYHPRDILEHSAPFCVVDSPAALWGTLTKLLIRA